MEEIMGYDEIRKGFEDDTRSHSMDIKKDDGLHRHLVFSNNGGSIYRFELTTWPGYLCISGDCGCFVFSRIADMFKFFRNNNINPHYWGEKLQSVSVFGGYKRYSHERFIETINEYVSEWEFKSESEKLEVKNCVMLDVLSCEKNDHDARAAADAFESEYGHRFEDLWEDDFEEHTPQYLWCLLAITEGIRRYDEHEGKQE